MLIDRGPVLKCTFNATPDNLVAFTNASNIKSLKVNGTSIKIEPIKNENIAFDVLGENISIDMETGEATFPESCLIKSPVTSWSFKAKDPNYVINENTYVCVLTMMDGMTIAQPMTIAEAMGYAFTTNDGVTLEAVDEFLDGMNMDIQYGLQIGFTLCDMDMNSGTFVFIDTEHQTNITTGGLSTYSFDSEGLYDVEIELSDSDMKDIQFAETPLISIEIGDGITSIGEYTFAYCSSLTDVTIGTGITSISSGAFEDCSGLTSIVIPDSVTEIGEYAFSSCSGLTGITIPDSVTTIGNNAFQNCSKLTSITIPDSVIRIGNSAFAYCSGLTSINIPNSVTSIASYAFYDCSGLPVENNLRYADTYLVEAADTTQTTYTIKENTKWVGDRAFEDCSGLTSIVIPDSVTEIGEYAFRVCTGLTSVNLGSSVTSIGEGAFYQCSGLTGELVIPNSVTSIGNSTFYGCKALTSVVIGSKCTRIGQYAFQGCYDLTSITCHATTAPSIYSHTFQAIKTDGTLSIPTGSNYSSWMSNNQYYLGYYNWVVLEIGIGLPEFELDGYDVAMLVQPSTNSSATKICNKTTDIAEIKVDDIVLDSVSTGHTFSTPYKWNVVRIKYADGVTSIPSSSFSACTRMYCMKIADSVTSIGNSAFSNCTDLTSIIIPNSVTSIGMAAFTNCSGLTSIVIPYSVKIIEYYTFRGCTGLTGELVIPDSVTSIGDRAFEYCTGLTGELVIPYSVTTIGEGAFRGCRKLTSIIIPDSVTSISKNSFNQCLGLTSVVIGSGCTNIGAGVFGSCSSLNAITCHATTAPSINSSTFQAVKTGGTLVYPEGSDYSSWMSTSSGYLGYYGWTIQYI